MKKWETPEVSNLLLDKTAAIPYVDYCNWVGADLAGVGNEDYTNPNEKPAQHPTWVWCHVHDRWHPKDHGTEDNGTEDTPPTHS